MPYLPQQPRVAFAAQPLVSRQPNGSELNAIHRFASHASRCSQCAHPYQTHLAGTTLCDRGHMHATAVAAYIYAKAGHAYSRIDRDNGYAATHIEIPGGCDAVRELLMAIERGLRIRRSPSVPVISYDKTYPVGPRIVQAPSQPQQPVQVIQVAEPRRHRTRPTHHGHAVVRHEKPVYVAGGRGSLYDADTRERQRRYIAESQFRAAATGGRSELVAVNSRGYYR